MSQERDDVVQLLVLSEKLIDRVLRASDIDPLDRNRLHLMKRIRRGMRSRLSYIPDEVWAEIGKELGSGEQQEEKSREQPTCVVSTERQVGEVERNDGDGGAGAKGG
jgi:hypothetical protein